MNVLVTGAAGYIGSHAVSRLLREGHKVVGIDNFFRGHAAAIELCRTLAPDRLVFEHADTGDSATLTRLMSDHKVEAVMHFAALAYVGESVLEPLRYYRNNVSATVGLLEAVAAAGVPRLVFSSSCSTYGDVAAENIPVKENCPQQPMSPYGRTKLQCEHVIGDFAESQRRANKPFSWAAMRYFNVCGCDRTGMLGEDHTPESHLIPVILQVALGQREHINLFGTDYPTPDGTCVRDYVHVDDLVDAHVKVMQRLDAKVATAEAKEAPSFNVGIGKGYSVREIIKATEKVVGKSIKVVEGPARAGDVAKVYADPTKIQRELGWRAQVTDIQEIIATAWKWFSTHPHGYRS